MPGLRGDELATQLSRIAPQVPIIVCSGNASDVTGLPGQVREVVEKPVSGVTLLTILQRVGLPVRR
jgi:CheY-like chemotaxis protein